MHIVLVAPEIPQNTGNIARTCALTGTKLHLVKPLGFSLEDRYLKRAGLDYWDKVEVTVWEDFYEVREFFEGNNIYLATTRGDKFYHQVEYTRDDVLVFGCETKGLPDWILSMYPQNRIRIPMRNIGRSLNLANAAAIILYEALRQTGFKGLV
ncbi:tRNA (cytidine/uridine-2'-O-)-methyltransferase [Thermosyntropha lipolytica DSM 11003]|uniref:Putative tRNA (cytidine(34)-2'-O)-methyltransferase n=1 Tax=Thermosyntropha lipolytica DSM 11003 TaxID=1123382 RepID=A0A1M5LYM4_9FIRM|nr:tRNA (cytidine(34)-2'-O)-methyltransferase [Thermosyntropha lipolytica]SHG70020.1 tRNA (cytidine/uridine-2'-O-)-methyltransferase [Thermosyntropha lipolytica DSM 11003]